MSDYDPPEFSGQRWLYGRKLHRCVECRREIRPGEYHHLIEGKWDGTFDRFRTCPHCWMLCRWLERDRGGDGYGIGSVLWDVSEDLRGSGRELLPVARAWSTAVRLQWRSRVTGLLLPISAKLPPRPPSPWEARTSRRPSLWSGDHRFTAEGWAEIDKYYPQAAAS